MRSTLSRVFVPVALAAALLAGCSSTVTGSASPVGGSPSVPGDLAEAQQQAEDLVEGGAPQENLDVCTLLSPADVEPVLGVAVEGAPSDAISGNACEWEDPATSYVIALEVGGPGTAPGGQLPPWETFLGEEQPLGDGVRVGPGGGIEFLAGDRDCFLQVVTADLDGDKDQATAVELAQVVRGKL